MSKQVVSITLDIPPNRDGFFPPIEDTVRGEFKFERVANSQKHSAKLPAFVPGQIIRVDIAESAGYIIEPLHHPEHAAVARHIRTVLNMSLPPKERMFPGIQVDMWLWHMRQFVEVGKARIVEGSFPKEIAYFPPDNRLVVPKRGEAKKRELFEKNPELAMQYQSLPREKQVEWERMVGI